MGTALPILQPAQYLAACLRQGSEAAKYRQQFLCIRKMEIAHDIVIITALLFRNKIGKEPRSFGGKGDDSASVLRRRGQRLALRRRQGFRAYQQSVPLFRPVTQQRFGGKLLSGKSAVFQHHRQIRRRIIRSGSISLFMRG